MGLSGSGLFVHRYWRGTVLLLSFRPMRTRPRFAYRVPKIGKGSFSPLGSVPRVIFGRAAPTSHQASGLHFAPAPCCKVFIMYTPNTLTLYIRAPILASSLRRPWPYRGGAMQTFTAL